MENALLGALLVLLAFCLGMLFEFFLHIKEIVDYVKQVNKANSSLRQFEKKMKQLEMEYMAYANEIIRLRTHVPTVLTAIGSGRGNGGAPVEVPPDGGKSRELGRIEY